MEYNKDKKKLQTLLREFEDIKNRLEDLNRCGIISEFYKHSIIDMTKKVLEHIAKNYEQIQKGVKSAMCGKILEYEAKTILNRGITQGKLEILLEMVRDGFISVTEAAKRLDISVEEFKSYMNAKGEYRQF